MVGRKGWTESSGSHVGVPALLGRFDRGGTNLEMR